MSKEELPLTQSSELDIEVARRQSFGEHYGRPRDLESRLKTYMSGQLILPPHPAYEGGFTDWAADPFNDRNWRFQHHTLRWLNPLRWAALEGDERARNEWLRIVQSWCTSNIPARRSPSDFAWVDMADGNRAIQLSLGAPLVSSQEKWYLESLSYHREWLMDPNNIVGKNHGLHQHCGLLVVGAVLRDTNAVDTAVTRLKEQFESTFDQQGMNDEGSVVYHQHNLIWWSQAWQRVRVEGMGVSPTVQKRLAAAASVLAHLSQPDGELPQIGNGARVKIRKGLSPATEFVASGGAKGLAPKESVLVLERGYIVSRSGWGENQPFENESHALIRYGRALRSHSHPDRGSVNIYTNNQRWLIDPGFFSYNPNESENKYLKARQTHNVASIVGRKHDHQAEVELATNAITSAVHDFTLLDNGYEREALSRRYIYLTRANCWIVFDKAESTEPVRISQNWQVEPGVSVQVRDNGFRLAAGQKSFNMYWLGRGTHLSMKRAGKDSIEGWVGTRWRTLERGTRLLARSAPGHPYLVTLLSPQDREPLSIVESRVSMTGNSLLLHISRGSARWIIRIQGGRLSIEEMSY